MISFKRIVCASLLIAVSLCSSRSLSAMNPRTMYLQTKKLVDKMDWLLKGSQDGLVKGFQEEEQARQEKEHFSCADIQKNSTTVPTSYGVASQNPYDNALKKLSAEGQVFAQKELTSTVFEIAMWKDKDYANGVLDTLEMALRNEEISAEDFITLLNVDEDCRKDENSPLGYAMDVRWVDFIEKFVEIITGLFDDEKIGSKEVFDLLNVRGPNKLSILSLVPTCLDALKEGDLKIAEKIKELMELASDGDCKENAFALFAARDEFRQSALFNLFNAQLGSKMLRIFCDFAKEKLTQEQLTELVSIRDDQDRTIKDSIDDAKKRGDEVQGNEDIFNELLQSN